MRAPRRQFRPGKVFGVGWSEKAVELVSRLRRMRSQYSPSNASDVQAASLSSKPICGGSEWSENNERRSISVWRKDVLEGRVHSRKLFRDSQGEDQKGALLGSCL